MGVSAIRRVPRLSRLPSGNETRQWALTEMATSAAWLSVLVKRRLDVIKPRTVVKCSWEDTFGSLLNKFNMTEVSIEKVQTAASEKFTDPVHIVPIDAPVSLCDQFKCMHVCISIEHSVRELISETRPNAFNVLMASSHDIVLPPILTPPDGSMCVLGLSEKQVFDLVWPNSN